MIRYDLFETRLGVMRAAVDNDGLVELEFTDELGSRQQAARWQRSPSSLARVRRQLREYLAGERAQFDVPLAPRGTPFQARVWRALQRIPYGRTSTYGALARAIGAVGAARAVGAANGRNPIAIIVPCHRVIGADGALTGYAGGLAIKRALLELEAARAERRPRASEEPTVGFGV